MAYINAMSTSLKVNKPGRPRLPEQQKRSGRLSMRVFPDVEAKARRVGTEAVEKAIRAIEESGAETVTKKP